jgi:peptidoglycan-N-acetylglucosamine deacetylase
MIVVMRLLRALRRFGVLEWFSLGLGVALVLACGLVVVLPNRLASPSSNQSAIILPPPRSSKPPVVNQVPEKPVAVTTKPVIKPAKPVTKLANKPAKPVTKPVTKPANKPKIAIKPRPHKPRPKVAQPPGLAAFAGTIVRHVDTGGRRVVALTFDDGPWPHTSSAVLALLAKYHAKATFFWIGRMLSEQPTIAKRVIAAGHAIGNHTWSHRYSNISPNAAISEIDRVEDNAKRQLKGVFSLFRPPGGRLTNGLVAEAKRQGYIVVMWSLLSKDTYQHISAATIAKNVIDNIKPGVIVLMHDGGGRRDKTVKALAQILPALAQQGYTFVTVPELLKMQVSPIATKRGKTSHKATSIGKN